MPPKVIRLYEPAKTYSLYMLELLPLPHALRHTDLQLQRPPSRLLV